MSNWLVSARSRLRRDSLEFVGFKKNLYFLNLGGGGRDDARDTLKKMWRIYATTMITQ